MFRAKIRRKKSFFHPKHLTFTAFQSRCILHRRVYIMAYRGYLIIFFSEKDRFLFHRRDTKSCIFTLLVFMGEIKINLTQGQSNIMFLSCLNVKKITTPNDFSNAYTFVFIFLITRVSNLKICIGY